MSCRTGGGSTPTSTPKVARPSSVHTRPTYTAEVAQAAARSTAVTGDGARPRIAATNHTPMTRIAGAAKPMTSLADLPTSRCATTTRNATTPSANGAAVG